LTKHKAKDKPSFGIGVYFFNIWSRKENSDASTKKNKKKKSIYQTGARDRIELAVRCERLLHVEGLTVTLKT
jgi:hypothetical protein